MSILKDERDLYGSAWTMGGYGDFSPGEKYLPLFIDALPEQFKDPLNMGPAVVGESLQDIEHPNRKNHDWRKPTILDAGAGSGKGTKALLDKGFAVAMCDVSFEGLEDLMLLTKVPATEACLWHDLKQTIYMAHCFDPANFQWDAHDADDNKFDWAYCTDVMEHIPPQFTMLVVQQLLNIVQNGVFFSISLVPDQFGYFAGEPLHKTVQPFTWWRDNLGELGSVIDARDLGNVGTYLVMKS